MTTSVTDDRARFEDWYRQRYTWEGKCYMDDNALDRIYDDSYRGAVNEAWEGWRAALRSQGKVVSVEKLEALRPYWCDWNDRALDEETDPEGSLKSFPTISIVYKYEDLTAIIGEGD